MVKHRNRCGCQSCFVQRRNRLMSALAQAYRERNEHEVEAIEALRKRVTDRMALRYQQSRPVYR
jgi:hypothetical protein